ncbi:MAG: hypothetical protein A2506_04445 [Elusimicrobia bacterium RIFOXYD12_FULL_66_9]|nr:MAG: hypothetical protein A2506_04445 [Elusimicrobia bacterium RIFOXYD12_FULL_66_9]
MGSPDSTRATPSYLVGVQLAVNAVSDACLLTDGPNCSVAKSDFIHGNHDLRSTLFDTSGRHRTMQTSVDPADVVVGREPSVSAKLGEMASADSCGVALLTSLPFCAMTAVDYGRVVRQVAAGTGKPVLNIPSASLSADWLDGYSDTLAALAGAVQTRRSRPRRGKVAIVGYLMDRAEQDHAANVAELRRLLEGLGLELVSVWPGNVPYAQLARACEAGTILSLPYGRQAARIIAEKTGADLLELGLPFGLGRTEDWVRAVATAFGRERKAEGLISRELDPVLKNLEWVVPQVLLHRRAAICADPYLFEGLARLFEDLGCELVAGAVMGRGGLSDSGFRAAHPGAPAPLQDPSAGAWRRELAAAGNVDFIVQNSRMETPGAPRAAVVELGFPSYAHHALTEEPFLGFGGCLHFVERVVNAILTADRYGSGRSSSNP